MVGFVAYACFHEKLVDLHPGEKFQDVKIQIVTCQSFNLYFFNKKNQHLHPGKRIPGSQIRAHGWPILFDYYHVVCMLLNNHYF